ncbi:MAG: hypothetical protein HUK25_03175, partial [Treponema sp.]|nr:hypothetical protein [Treponema sp.]
ADKANIGVASLYRAFETKAEITIQAGILLWNNVQKDFLDYIGTAKDNLSGKEELEFFLSYFKILFNKHKAFIKFLDDFDHLMLSEKIDPQKLSEYEDCVINLQEPLLDAYTKGVKDKSLRKNVNIKLVYSSVTKALIAVSQKYLRGNILPGDNFSEAEKELEELVTMTVYYLSQKNK